MRTYLLDRAKPVHYAIISVLFFCVFIWHFLSEFAFFSSRNSGLLLYGERLIIGLILISTLFVGNHIVKRNKLDNKSSYMFLINMLFYVIFWDIFSDSNSIIANFLLLLAVRNLVSSRSFLISKSRIFNASLFVSMAAVFHSWALLYLFLVFSAILITFQKDYRRLIVPFIGVGVVVFWYAIVFFLQQETLNGFLKGRFLFGWEWFHFLSLIKQMLFGFYVFLIGLALMSFFIEVNTMSKKIKDSFFKIFLFLIVGVVFALVSTNKTNNLLVFTFFPVSLLITKTIETTYKDWIRNLLLISLVLITIVSVSSFYWEQYLF